MAKSTQATPPVTATRISIGQKFNWTVAEVVDVQGNLYAYLGYEILTVETLRIAKWQNGWIELTYPLTGGLCSQETSPCIHTNFWLLHGMCWRRTI